MNAVPEDLSPDDGKKKPRKPSLPQTDVPSYPLSETIRVPRAMADHLAKQPSTPLQVAKALEMQPTTGWFRSLTSASLAYGLTEGSAWAEQISLTDIGRRSVAPTSEGDDEVALREAVMRPRITAAFLQRYAGSKWPRDDIARNVLGEMGVPNEHTERALGLIRADAEFVGFIVPINGGDFVDLGSPLSSVVVADALASPQVLASVTTIGLPTLPEPEPQPEPTALETRPDPKASRVFVSHGKNRDIVEQIKEILTFGKFQPVVSIENESVAKPVPDKVLDDMRSCFAGIVHVGPEKKLIDEDGNEVVMVNPNVLIEIGGAMALYGRRFVLLVEKGVTLPSNLQGLYEVRYEGKKLDYEATMKLLKAFNQFQEPST